ncbi:unknown [Clostridium sp. CAG:1000]|nr:unknown [Clostridium sp. CAG:1000]
MVAANGVSFEVLLIKLFSILMLFNEVLYSSLYFCLSSSVRVLNLEPKETYSSAVICLNVGSFILLFLINDSLNSFSSPIFIVFNFDKSTNVPELAFGVTSTIKKFSYAPLPSTSTDT